MCCFYTIFVKSKFNFLKKNRKDLQINNILHFQSAFFKKGFKALLPILSLRQEIVIIMSLHLGRFAASQAHAPSALTLQYSPQPTGTIYALVNKAN